MKPAMPVPRRSGSRARRSGHVSLRINQGGCGSVCRATRANGRVWLLPSSIETCRSAGKCEQTFDIEMRFDVIGERIQCALHLCAVTLVCDRNIQLREKGFPETVRSEQAVQIAALHTSIG